MAQGKMTQSKSVCLKVDFNLRLTRRLKAVATDLKGLELDGQKNMQKYLLGWP